ncbi:neuromedin-U isoform X2 [Pungitius pungitius]|uniref:neuromedin-U isoform X2 n=1 Tax=Pungitius pungitius TaxID=134920 RepID=UPI002E14E924
MLEHNRGLKGDLPVRSISSSSCALHSDAALFHRWGDGRFRKVRGTEGEDLSDVLWRDQSDEQIQNVFKRFLFHYSKARNSVGALQHESTSVHPLMRLSPKLSQGRKKKFLLLRIRGLPEGTP